MLQEYDAGKSGQSFYHTSMTPDNWYKWFDPENHDSDEGWTEVRQGILHYLWSKEGKTLNCKRWRCREDSIYCYVINARWHPTFGVLAGIYSLAVWVQIPQYMTQHAASYVYPDYTPRSILLFLCGDYSRPVLIFFAIQRLSTISLATHVWPSLQVLALTTEAETVRSCRPLAAT